MLLTDMLTSPTIAGERGREMMRNYGFVLRMLAGSPDRAAEKLVDVLAIESQSFCRVPPLQALDAIPGAAAHGLGEHHAHGKEHRSSS